ncbi:hypothetical protein F8388_022903 [Cannabis sativa]|uniref:Protein kinase domain-containing protein n=1 Tax=Cannabis sativa TaxID=3483 RepID=A0A7J6FF56_CANSA|nr:hypothetical protein F8388_022903 [Cannabis sativa]
MRSLAEYLLLFLTSGVLIVVCEAFVHKEVHQTKTGKYCHCLFGLWDFVGECTRSSLIRKSWLCSVLALTTFKEAIYEDPHLVLSNWNALDFDPCDWNGISCTGSRDHVIKINITGASLRGFIAPELGQLSFLQELYGSSLHVILLYAPGSNSTGFCRSSQFHKADFSYNFFVGSIPKCLEYLPRTSFQGNCLQHKDIKQRPKKQCDGVSPIKSHAEANQKHQPLDYQSKHQGTSRPTWLLALEVVTGVMVGSLFLVALLTAFQKCNTKSSLIIPWKKSASEKEHVSVYIDSELLKDVVRFSRPDLEVACEDFSNIIGTSPDSVVYKGNMRGGSEIAVISLCIKEENWTGFLELYFQKEVADLARLGHENTGKLLGYCSESVPFTRMLVFEYACNGTLYEHLHYGEGCQLSWTRRMKIIIGIARGLKYLHSEIEPPFTISELNSSAVYLTEDFSPKLVDFESWKGVIARSEKYSGSIDNQGSICVLPNSLEARYLDIQGNLYAFGVLLLEIISGRPPYCKDKGCLLDWAKEYIELPEVMSYLVDPELKHFKYEDLMVICEVVNLCINEDPTKRPQMQVICNMLETRIDTTVAIELKSSSLAWAELALSS